MLIKRDIRKLHCKMDFAESLEIKWMSVIRLQIRKKNMLEWLYVVSVKTCTCKKIQVTE